MEYYEWPEDLDDKFGRQQQFTVMEYGEDYEITDWTDVSLTHLLKLQQIIDGEWNVPLIIKCTEQLRIDLKMNYHQGLYEEFVDSEMGSQRDRAEGPSSILLNAAARALLDSGSLADSVSTTLADQLKIMRELLKKPLQLQLAVHGYRSKINFCANVDLRYQDISEK
ncbi:hypothetical protein M422DRAFT_250279 [Sphaerobolus stellatus SS14]|uniref:Uncharacterized protein n=1 Tax=Sphaerobolus stellatus (strain SS14) TaxID=990650 RepID=A0A0C9W399_SPHS4|nr:hypothetical protein M422DRAFT_250279 [Sphaerobolus stellatus SS14]